MERDDVEEVDTRGEDEEYFYSESMKEKIEHETIKIGQPWNIPIDTNDPKCQEKIQKQGQEAKKLQELREALAKMVK